MQRLPLAVYLALALAPACSSTNAGLADAITVDGSSTVFPLTTAVVEASVEEHPSVRIAVGVSGTTAGFDRFCQGKLDIQNASRPITRAERDNCAGHETTFVEVPVAYDAVTVIVPVANDWVDALSLDELRRLWEPAAEGRVTRWSDVRPGWPADSIALYGPGPLSGTFDFFTEVIVGTLDASRRDYSASEDDEVIVKGVASNRLALGYVGYGYFERHRDVLRAIPIAGRTADRLGPVAPSPDNVHRGVYAPLARPLFIYVNKAAMARPAVAGLVRFYLAHVEQLAGEVGGIALSSRAYELARRRVESGTEGTLFDGTPPAGNIETLLGRSSP